MLGQFDKDYSTIEKLQWKQHDIKGRELCQNCWWTQNQGSYQWLDLAQALWQSGYTIFHQMGPNSIVHLHSETELQMRLKHPQEVEKISPHVSHIPLFYSTFLVGRVCVTLEFQIANFHFASPHKSQAHEKWFSLDWRKRCHIKPAPQRK